MGQGVSCLGGSCPGGFCLGGGGFVQGGFVQGDFVLEPFGSHGSQPTVVEPQLGKGYNFYYIRTL